MGQIADRLAELELELPRPFAPPPGVQFPFDLVHTSGNLAYISGHLPVDGADVLMTGRVGSELELEQGYEAALFYPIVNPPEGPQILPDEPPGDFGAFQESVADRPGFKWVEEMFRKHRQPAATAAAGASAA